MRRSMRSAAQSGYTLIEVVIVIALSAFFVILVLQNTTNSQSTQQFISAVEKVKSVIHDAQTQGDAGEASSSNIAGFLCGTRLRIYATGGYQLWRIYDTNDTGSGGTMTYQSVTGGAQQSFAGSAMDIQNEIGSASGPDPAMNADGSYTGAVSQDVDMVFLGANPSAPIGQAYVYTNFSSEPAGGANGTANCSDFGANATANNLANLFFNVYSGTNHTTAHLATVVLTTDSGSVRNRVLR